MRDFTDERVNPVDFCSKFALKLCCSGSMEPAFQRGDILFLNNQVRCLEPNNTMAFFKRQSSVMCCLFFSFAHSELINYLVIQVTGAPQHQRCMLQFARTTLSKWVRSWCLRSGTGTSLSSIVCSKCTGSKCLRGHRRTVPLRAPFLTKTILICNDISI